MSDPTQFTSQPLKNESTRFVTYVIRKKIWFRADGTYHDEYLYNGPPPEYVYDHGDNKIYVRGIPDDGHIEIIVE